MTTWYGPDGALVSVADGCGPSECVPWCCDGRPAYTLRWGPVLECAAAEQITIEPDPVESEPVEPGSLEDSEGGCGCAAAGHGTAGWLLLPGLVAALGRRGRRPT